MTCRWIWLPSIRIIRICWAMETATFMVYQLSLAMPKLSILLPCVTTLIPRTEALISMVLLIWILCLSRGLPLLLVFLIVWLQLPLMAWGNLITILTRLNVIGWRFRLRIIAQPIISGRTFWTTPVLLANTTQHWCWELLIVRAVLMALAEVRRDIMKILQICGEMWLTEFRIWVSCRMILISSTLPMLHLML